MPTASPEAAAAAPVAVFDSGVGGLSVLRALQALLPQERFLYLADSAWAPYGGRTPQAITARVLQLAEGLHAHGAKALVLACNTATVVAVQPLRARFAGWPVVGMEPAIKPAAAATRSGVVGVLATAATVASPAVQRLCALWGQHVRVLLQPCPGWVEQVERGELDTPATRAAVAQHLAPLLREGADTLVLGCTHYPFLVPLIQAEAGPGVALIDPAPAVARQLQRRLQEAGLAAPAGMEGVCQFFTTGLAATVAPVMQALWGAPLGLQAWPAGDSPAAAGRA